MTITMDRTRVLTLGRSRDRGRLGRMTASVHGSASDAARVLRDPRSRRHQRAAMAHLRRAARRAQRIGLGRAVDDRRVKLQLALGYRHLAAARKAPDHRLRRRLVAGGVLTGMVVGGAAVGITRARSVSEPLTQSDGDAEPAAAETDAADAPSDPPA